MATNVKIQGEVVKLEKKTSLYSDRQYLEVTVKKQNDMVLVFETPVHRAKSYPMGRVVTVNIKAI